MDDYLIILKNEFEAEEDSFLYRLKNDMEWDRDAFLQLEGAMRTCCEHRSDAKMIERWIAEGFWSLPGFIRGWVSHPNFSDTYPGEYYKYALKLLDDLAFWFFTGKNIQDSEITVSEKLDTLSK